jgi:hypothetical protein
MNNDTLFILMFHLGTTQQLLMKFGIGGQQKLLSAADLMLSVLVQYNPYSI